MKLLDLTEVQKDHVIAAFKWARESSNPYMYLVGWFEGWMQQSGFRGIQLEEFAYPTEGASLSAQLELPLEGDLDLAYHRRNEDKMLEARARFEWEEDQRDFYQDEGGEG